MTVHSEVLSEEGCACAEAPGRLDAKSLLEPHFTALAVSCNSTELLGHASPVPSEPESMAWRRLAEQFFFLKKKKNYWILLRTVKCSNFGQILLFFRCCLYTRLHMKNLLRLE